MRARNRWLLVVAAVVVVLVAATALFWWRTRASTDLTAPKDVDDVTAAITAAVPDALRTAHVPGAEVAVVQDGEIVWTRGFGVPEGTVFEAGSISKTVAAAAILSLADRGTVDLDVPVSRYLTSWRLPEDAPAAGRVTLRRLLSHTAGIDTAGYLGIPATRPLPTTAQSLDGAATGAAVRQVRAPGEYEYSGGGFTIAQQAIEDVTGQPFAAVVRQEVLAPLQMDQSGYDCTQAASPGPDDAAGHLANGRPAPRYRYAEAAAAGLCTTGADLARFAGWLASPDPRAVRMRRPADGTGGRYGLGVEVLRHQTAGHNGVNRGFYAQLLVNSRARVALVVLTDGDGGRAVVDAVLDAWHDAA